MNTQLKKHSQNTTIIASVLVFIVWVEYLVITLMKDSSAALQRYNLSELQLSAIQIGFALPVLVVWLTILIAALSFYLYSRKIRSSADGKAFLFFSYGLFITLFASIAGIYFSLVQQIVSGGNYTGSDSENILIISRNYTTLLLALLSYWYFFKGAAQLLSTLTQKTNIKKFVFRSVLILLPVALGFIFLLFTNATRTFSTSSDIVPTYVLPDSLILLTIVLPYFIVWVLGVSAVLGIVYFKKHTKGTIYRLLFKRFSLGISIVIILGICLQFLTQFSDFFSRAGIGVILAIVAVIYIVWLVGYVLVVRGARELRRIEMVLDQEKQ